MKKYQISQEDMNTHFFHFTKYKNLKSIKQNGLVPKIGAHAKYIEKNDKVFFVEGLDNFIILFDCWINCYFYIPIIPFIYKLGAFFLRKKWFPMFIADGYFGILKKSKLQRKRAFKIFDRFLDNSVVLKLNLDENVDFSYEDTDEIKARGYKKRHLILMGYSEKYSSVENTNMDRWNMHTFAHHGINPEKIEFCVLENGKYKLRDIFYYCLENTKIDLKDVCPIVYDYLKERKLI